MKVLDSRRLRGPNLQTREPAAVAEVRFAEGEDPDAAVAAWLAATGRIAARLGWAGDVRAVARRFPGGAALAVVAPVDLLLEATELNETAVYAATDLLAGRDATRNEGEIEELAARVAGAGNARLRALRAAAVARDVPFLWDDDAVTLGMARRAVTFPMAELPAVDAVDWRPLGRIPVVLVTGTNGKTTTARLLARMVACAGLVPGSTSTDGISVGDRVIEAGDWTGAEAARIVLRRPEVDVAVLETARGGILRRGLGVDACDVAVLTNVDRDHLGEFGVLDIKTMVRAKAIVASVVRPGGRVVLNAEDARLVTLVPTLPARAVLFATVENAATRAHVDGGGEVFTVRGGRFLAVTRDGARPIASVDEAPITFRGGAPYNVANALAALAAGASLGLPTAALREALLTFGTAPGDNPGRGRVVETSAGARVVFDFGHNPAGVRALYVLARSLAAPGASIASVHTQAGDRTPADTEALARVIAAASPRLVVAWESPSLLRGREPGDIAGRLQRCLVAAGMPEDRVAIETTEPRALDRALRDARKGDVVVVSPNVGRDEAERVAPA